MWWMIPAVLAQPYQATVLYPCTAPLEEVRDEVCDCDPFEQTCPDEGQPCSKVRVVVAGGPRVLSPEELTRLEATWPTPSRIERFDQAWESLHAGPQCGGVLGPWPDESCRRGFRALHGLDEPRNAAEAARRYAAACFAEPDPSCDSKGSRRFRFVSCDRGHRGACHALRDLLHNRPTLAESAGYTLAEVEARREALGPADDR